jgi:DNA-binding beta-propeller fold protein YncE
MVDHLASKNSLVYDAQQQLLFAVNAGSNTITEFAAHGDQLFPRQIVSSGGTFPVSIAIHGNLLYVLNALGGGSLQGYRVLFGHVIPIPGSSRALGLDPTATPQYTNTPGDVAFTPDGRHLIVTTKANGNDVDVFGVDFLGRLSASPVVNSEPAAVPFAIAFDPAGDVMISEAGPNAVESFALGFDGVLHPLSSVATGQAATCWVVADGSLLFAGNAGSATETSVLASPFGTLTLLGTTSTDGGTVDAATSPDGRFLYVQTGASGIVDEFSVGAGGTLAEIGSVTVANAIGGEGLATS